MRRLIPILAAAVLAACGGSSGGGETPTAATPVFTPGTGTYSVAQAVVISTTTPGATIHYTSDGSTPTTGSTVYSAAVPVSTSATLKAIATAPGYATSAVGTASYTINTAAVQAATPVITPGTGSYTAAQTVTMTCSTPGSTIHYTLDGTTPTATSTPYTGAFQVTATTTVKAIATATGYTASPMATAILTINISAADFATFCAGLQADVVAQQVSCYKANPDAVAASGGISCDGMTMDIQAGRLVYDAAHAADCRAAVIGAACNDMGGEPAACRLALVGQVANGSICYDGTACPDGYCSATAGACPGLCVPYATAGQPCSGGDECAAGLVCDYSTSTCKTPSAAGGACPCLAGLYCDATSKCAAQQTSGTCTSWDACATGYTCTGSPTTTCQPLVGLGGACSQTNSVCGWGYNCGTSNTCVAAPALGESCTPGEYCIGGYCDYATSKCVADPYGGTCSAAPSVSGLTLYDAFMGSALDGTKWQSGSITRGVSGGAAVLGVDVTNMRARSVRNDQYLNLVNVPASATNRVTTLQADLTVPAASAARTGGATIKASVRLLYSPPSQRLLFPAANKDLLLTEVGLTDDGSGLKAFRQFSHCDDASCATYTATGIATVDPSTFADINIGSRGAGAAYDTTYTVTISLDETTGIFSWTIAGGAFGSGVTGTADPSAYLAATPDWTSIPLGGAGFQAAQIGVRTADLGTGGASARIAGRFDNVWVGRNNAASMAYDDFSGAGINSGPDDLSPVRWGTPGTTTVGPTGGSLLIHHHLSAAASGNTITGGSVSAGLPIGNPTTTNALQADIAFGNFATTGSVGGSGSGGLFGRFFNDGSGFRSGDATGDIQASVGIGVQSASGTANWSISRCTSASGAGACASSTQVGIGMIPGTGYNAGGHRLLLKWDPASRKFTFGVDGSTVTIDPTVAGGGITAPVAYVGPAFAPLKNVNGSASLNTTTPGTYTNVDIRFSDVLTGP